MINLILDGALYSECEMFGGNSYGMIRIAEEVIKGIIQNKGLEIYFNNTMYSKKYDLFLKMFLDKRYPEYSSRILSRPPVFSTSLPGLSRLSGYLAKYLPFEVKSEGLERGDIYHSFYYPFTRTIQNTAIKKSITYLDIIPLRMKGYNNAMVDITRRVVKSIESNYAISISDFSRKDLLDYNRNIDADRVFVAPLAASKELFFPNRDKNEWLRVKKKYDLPENYFLSVSSTDRRKNLPHLIKCFSQFVMQEKPDDLFLVLAGNAKYSYDLVDMLKISKTVRDRIVITNRYIENEDLSIVYSNALCFFFMSLYEGFGLPALEAMQCGIPVVTSNVSSLPEVVGNAAVMIDPSDEDMLCDTMNKMFVNKALREKYAAAGILRAGDFSWEKCVDDYLKIFKIISAD